MTLASYLGPCSGHQPEGSKIRHHESYDVQAVQTTCGVLKAPKVMDGEKQSRHLSQAAVATVGSNRAVHPPWVLCFLLVTLGRSCGVAMRT